MASNLTLVLREHYADAPNLNDLFDKEWPQLTKSGSWKITNQRIKKDQQANYFLGIALTLHANGVEGISHFEQLISKVNREWTRTRSFDKNLDRKAKPTSEIEPSVIKFSSKSHEYGWLSNFFPTLVVLPDEPQAVYLSAEEAYQKKKAEMHGETLIGDDPLTLKQLGSRIRLNPDFDREALMQQVVTEKFRLNPVLKAKLQHTQEIRLEEDTDSAYWGNAHGKGGKNRLGVILASVRTNLNDTGDFPDEEEKGSPV